MSLYDSAETWSAVDEISPPQWGEAVNATGRELLEERLHDAVGDRLVAESPAMRSLLTEMDRHLEAPQVLVEGETGTGKDLVARVLHCRAGDGATPFLELDAPHLSPRRFEAELERLSPVATGGTLLVSEILDLSHEHQISLVRTLDRVRTSHETGHRARVVCVTQQNVDDKERAGRLLTGLKDRLRPFTLRVPTLRERHEDLPELIRTFLHELAVRYGRSPRELSPEVRDALLNHSWRGNARELRNEIERLVVLAPADRPVGPAALSPALQAGGSARAGRPARRERRNGSAARRFHRRWLQAERAPAKTAVLSSDEPAFPYDGSRTWSGRVRRRSRK